MVHSTIWCGNRISCGRRKGTTRTESHVQWVMTVLLNSSFLIVAVQATLVPSFQPSISPKPSAENSWIPSTIIISGAPLSESRSNTPTTFPTQIPSNEGNSWWPSVTPSQTPTITMSTPTPTSMSLSPSGVPSNSPLDQPSNLPSRISPTLNPSFSFYPSHRPTTSSVPTVQPSSDPSTVSKPTQGPTLRPSSYPTYVRPSRASEQFRQLFLVGNGRKFNETEKGIFEDVMESYTPILVGQVNSTSSSTVTVCTLLLQETRKQEQSSKNITRNLKIIPKRNRDLELERQEVVIAVYYSLLYRSTQVNVSTFPSLFLEFNSQHIMNITQDLRNAGLYVLQSFEPMLRLKTDSPTVSPSSMPSMGLTSYPSSTPSRAPSSYPLSIPSSMAPEMFSEPSSSPTHQTSLSPSSRPSADPDSNKVSKVLIICVTLGGALALICLVCLYHRRMYKKEPVPSSAVTRFFPSDEDFPKTVNPINAMSQNAIPLNDPFETNSMIQDEVATLEALNESGASDQRVVGVLSCSSGASLLSSGNDWGVDSSDDFDKTRFLVDEFDRYKDKNLEQLRIDVEGTVKEVEEMLSCAMTNTLLDEDEGPVDNEIVCWGGRGDPSEIEASALCEVNDWLKREEGATIDDRRRCMQDILSRMVSSVRHGVIGPKQASRAIHECAAMLGLPLAVQLDQKSIIVTGMRKTVTKDNLLAGFIEFGAVNDSAVSSNARGFGVVRFQSPMAAQRALAQYKRAEIVVQDVAVTIKVLSSSMSPVTPGKLC